MSLLGSLDGGHHSENELLPDEGYWRDHYDWLLSSGYQLRSRYDPKWVPSWTHTGSTPILSEDGQTITGPINHAIRVQGNIQVALKRVKKSEFQHEVDIMTYLSQEPLDSHPRNHCIPVLDVLDPPDDDDTAILAMPLGRNYDEPDFDTMGEAIDFIQQIIEGFQFLHENRIAHKDIAINNILMDGSQLYPKGFHPCWHDMTLDYSRPISAKYTRTQKPPKYWIIDFGLSRQYGDAEIAPMETPFQALKSTVPEFNNGATVYNPFPTDVYNLGEMIKQEFLDGNPSYDYRNGREGFEFLRPFLDDMTHQEPEKRPTMDEVASRFNAIVKGLPVSTLRSRCIPKPQNPANKDPLLLTAIKALPFWVRRLGYVLRRTPPIPTRK